MAFGFLGMGPVTIAVDSYGPVTDNAQSVYELSQIEGIKNVKQQIKTDFGFDADFENAKYQLEKGDGAGNTFKATAKPVLIGTAVVGATTMVFGIIMLLENMFGDVVTKLSIVQPEIILGLIMGGAVIYWFTGASCQAVVTGAYRAVVYIKEHMKLDSTTASEKDSKEVVRICTVYAQKGMWNIFIVIFCFALALPFFNPYFFIGYLIGIAFFGLFQAIFMANAGGAWDNAKKIVEVDLRQKGTELHAATVVGDTVGDPFKDTSSVAMNPVIKFTTLFGLLAVEIAVTMKDQSLKTGIGVFFFLVALCFVYRSFYGMRIPEEDTAGTNGNLVLPHNVPRDRGGGRQEVVTLMNTLNRRDWLRVTGAAALGLPLVGHAAPDLRARAKKNLKLGVFTGVYASLPLEEAARRIAADGFHGVVLEYAFADVRFDPWAPDWDKARLITSTLAKHNLKIAGLFGYYNLVDPDPARRQRGEQRMQVLIENWKQFGCPIISTETGTLNDKSEWLESPENATEKGYQACRAALEKLTAGGEEDWRGYLHRAVLAERD